MVAPIINMPNTEKHSGVSGIPTQLLVLHSGESPLRGGYAQSLTNWANVPLAQGGPVASWHWFVDPIAIVSMIDVLYAAWHASEANPMSEGFEQSGYARYTRAEWLTPEGLKQIDNLSWIMALRAKANGIPPVWLTTAQVNAITSGRDRTTKGLCTHRQIDPETRTDPGDGYPFDVLTAKIRAYMGAAAIAPHGTTPPIKKDWFDMATEAQLRKIIQDENPWGYRNPKLEKDDAYALLRAARTFAVKAATESAATAAQISGLVGAIKAVAKGEPFDEAKLLSGIQAAAAAGVKEAIDSVESTTTTTVNIVPGGAV